MIIKILIKDEEDYDILKGLSWSKNFTFQTTNISLQDYPSYYWRYPDMLYLDTKKKHCNWGFSIGGYGVLEKRISLRDLQNNFIKYIILNEGCDIE